MALPVMQTRLDEKEAAESRATKSESEVSELSKRLVEIKMGEADRINKARAFFVVPLVQVCSFCITFEPQYSQHHLNL